MKMHSTIIIQLLLIAYTTGSPHIRSPGYKFQPGYFAPDPLIAAASEDIPMVHNNNYDMIMPEYYDSHPAESMELQNFQTFYDPQMIETNEYKMDESQFVKHTPVRAPQPLTPEERRIRQKLEPVNVLADRKMLQKLKKGSTMPRRNAVAWDQFDYDLYSVDPAKKQKSNASV